MGCCIPSTWYLYTLHSDGEFDMEGEGISVHEKMKIIHLSEVNL